MKFRTIALATAALSLAASPAIAEVSFGNAAFDRALAPIEGESEAGESGSGIILAVLAAAAVLGGVVAATGSGDDNAVSP